VISERSYPMHSRHISLIAALGDAFPARTRRYKPWALTGTPDSRLATRSILRIDGGGVVGEHAAAAWRGENLDCVVVSMGLPIFPKTRIYLPDG
jgi:hypothetical protein